MWNRKLGRTADHRKALLRNMATSLIESGQIETTIKCCNGSACDTGQEK